MQKHKRVERDARRALDNENEENTAGKGEVKAGKGKRGRLKENKSLASK